MDTQVSDTEITVRVQALGGMFLSAHSAGYTITISYMMNGDKVQVSGPGVSSAAGDHSGSRHIQYKLDAESHISNNAIIVPPDAAEPIEPSEPTIMWVEAETTTTAFRTTLPLSEPTQIEIKASIPLPPPPTPNTLKGGSQGTQEVSVTQWLIPGHSNAEFVLCVPGLWVQGPEFSQDTNTSNAVITASVKMMCGCIISDSGPWPSSGFDVYAYMEPTSGSGGTPIGPIPMRLGTSPSIFTGSLDQTLINGEYALTVYASQKRTNNIGVSTLKNIIVL